MLNIIRIRFTIDQDRIKGNYILATNTMSWRLRGDIFEIFEQVRKLLDEHQLHYTVLPIPESDGSDQELRVPITIETQRRERD